VKKDLLIAVAALAAVAAISFGVSQFRPDLPLNPSQPFTGESAAADDKPDPTDKVIMHVNGAPVTEREFNAFVMQFPEQMREVARTPEGKERVAHELAKLKALEQEGQKMGGDRDPDSRAALRFARANLNARYALEKLAPKADEQRVRQEYEKVRSNPAASEWSHIMVAYQGGQAPPRQGAPLPLEQARKKAELIVQRIRAGAAFADLARAESDDSNSFPAGGALGNIDASGLPEPVRALKVGQISDPVVTPFGVHIFKLDAPPLERIRPQLEQQIRAESMQSTADRVAGTARIELDPAFFGTKKPS
jgi:peptidyl-prolyl cis-trans isomerase C